MIRVQKTDNGLLQASKFPAAVGRLTNREKGMLDAFEGLGYVVFDKTENIFPAFFKDLIFELLASQKIYFILVENSPAPVSKSRSHRKLLYDHRKEIGTFNFMEMETTIDESHFSGIDPTLLFWSRPWNPSV